MKRFLFPSIFFFTILLFSFTSNVNADTIYNVDISQFDYINSIGFTTLKSLGETYLSEHSDYNCFRISHGSPDIYYLVISKCNASNYLFTYTTWTQSSITYTGFRSSISVAGNVISNINYRYENNEVITGNSNTIRTYYFQVYDNNSTLDYSQYLYFYFPGEVRVNSAFTLYMDENNSLSISANGLFPSLYDIYLSYTPIPTDNTPLLTSFFSLTIEKLQLVTEYFSSNYVYLSIFAIFILIFFLYLIKRRLL